MLEISVPFGNFVENCCVPKSFIVFSLQQEGKESTTSMLLPDDFSPTETEIIVGKGKKRRRHKGNQILDELIGSKLVAYGKADKKFEKSVIIGEVLDHVRSKSPVGAFVKQDPNTKRWYKLEEDQARERVSQAFRNKLGIRYKSSGPSRKR